jgi:hypothetical protein
MPMQSKRRTEENRRRLPLIWGRFLDRLTKLVLGPRRLDHEPMYSSVHAGVVIGALSIIIAGNPAATGSALAGLSDPTQKALAACMFMGSFVCLLGICMGTPFDVWRQTHKRIRRLQGKPELLAMDLRRPYSVATWGSPTTIVGMGYYCATVTAHSAHLIQGFTGFALIAFVALGLFFQWLRFLMEIRRIDRTVPVLIKQEIERRIVEQWLNP